jgi:ketosteroid isomerase-like protein
VSTPTELVQNAYAAFGRRDISAILEMLTDDVQWEFISSASGGSPYAGRYSGKEDVRRWFGVLAQSDDIQQFEPREFLAGPNHVTVLGWERTRVLPNGGVFESDWIHVFMFKGDKVSRWIGAADTAARVAVAGR